MYDVSIVGCADYEPAHLRTALSEAFAPFGGFSFVREGMTVCIKANLVHASKPEQAAVTHPALLAELTRLLVERGARVIVGDSPGGLYNASAMRGVYRACGMEAVEEAGGSLNHNFETETVTFPEGMVAKEFLFTSWLKEADLVIDACKLKTHGMMGMSGAAKNLFGVVPGLTKPEYHYRYPDHADFARMLVDLDDYVAPAFSVCDAIEGMEGNGPTGGTPRHIGCVMVSPSPHKLDLLSARIIGLSPEEVPTLMAAKERGYLPNTAEELHVAGDVTPFLLSDFQNVGQERKRLFCAEDYHGLKRVAWSVAEKVLAARPDVHKDMCVGCGKCRNMCPAGAIVLENGKATIHRSRCIRCFCCQEFCPMSAIKVKRSAFARLVNR